MENTNNLQSLHSQLKFLFMLVKITSSVNLQRVGMSIMVLLKCHQERIRQPLLLRQFSDFFKQQLHNPCLAVTVVLVFSCLCWIRMCRLKYRGRAMCICCRMPFANRYCPPVRCKSHSTAGARHAICLFHHVCEWLREGRGPHKRVNF